LPVYKICGFFYAGFMGVVTKMGDKGRTRLLSGEEVGKAELRLEVSGTVDELCSHLGLARSFISDADLADEVRKLTVDLFRICAELASNSPDKQKWLEPTEAIHVERMEKRIEAIEQTLRLPPSFIVPGATKASASLDIARAVARRLERRVSALADAGGYANPQGVIYLNRLSDYLFLLARAVEKSEGVPFDAK